VGELTCGLKKVGVWSVNTLIVPGCGAINYFSSNYNTFKKSFPFNAYFDFANTVNTAINTATSSTSTTQVFGIPFVNKGTTSFSILPIISSSTMTNAIGSSNNTLYRTTIGFLIWIFTALLIYFTVRKV